MLVFALAFTPFVWAEPVPLPSGQLDVKIVREFEENGESKRAEFNPTFRLDEQSLAMPALQDENAQQMLTSLMKMFAAQAGPLLQQYGNGQPFQMILEVPTMKEKINIEVTPRP